jgi:hypothetical protein
VRVVGVLSDMVSESLGFLSILGAVVLILCCFVDKRDFKLWQTPNQDAHALCEVWTTKLSHTEETMLSLWLSVSKKEAL